MLGHNFFPDVFLLFLFLLSFDLNVVAGGVAGVAAGCSIDTAL